MSVAGTYNLTVTGDNGCTSEASAEVILDSDAPGATAQGGTLTCEVTSIQLIATGNGSFAWTGPNGFTSNDQNPIVSVAGTYNLVVTGDNGCTSEASAEVALDVEQPFAGATGGPLSCETFTIQLLGEGNGTYAWTGPNGFTSNEQNPIVSVVGTYVLTVTGANGCTNSAEADVWEGDCDECPPMIISCDADTTIECGTSIHPYDVGHPIFRKDGSCPDVDVSWGDEWFGECPYTLLRHWTAWDDLGNVETCIQTITVIDTQAPAIMNVPADVVVECSAIPEPSADVFAADACKEGYSVQVTDVVHEGDCTDSYVIERTYWSVDDCGNTGSAVQQIMVVDQTAPVLHGLPEAVLEVACDDVPAPAAVWAEDLCDPTVEVEYEQVMIPGNGDDHQLVRTWTAVDRCGNPVSFTQVINVIGCNEECPPMIISCDADTTIECGTSIHPYDVGHPIFRKDGSCPDVDVSWGDEWFGECPYTLLRHWTAWDDFGNVETCIQTITVIDTQAPVIMNVPADVVVECSAIPEPSADVFAADACKEGYSVQVTDVTHAGDCATSYLIERTYWSVDDCGNTGSAVQWIMVTDQTAPEFVCDLSDITVDCYGIPDPAEGLAVDNCSDDVTVTMTEWKSGDGCTFNYEIIRTWTATDPCGNSTTVEQVITVVNENDVQKSMDVTVTPNPFRDRTMVRFVAPEAGRAVVVITDMHGRMIAEVHNAPVQEGQAVQAFFEPPANSGGMFLYRVVLNDIDARGRIMFQP